MKHLVAILLCLLCLWNSTHAQVIQVRVKSELEEYQLFSGAVIQTCKDEGSFILSCAHAFDGAGSGCVVEVKGKEWRPADVVSISTLDDLSLIKTDYWFRSSTRVADVAPGELGAVVMAGFLGHSREFVRLHGFQNDKSGWMYVSGPHAKEGMSGGPILFGGRICGVLRCYTVPGEREPVSRTIGPGLAKIKKFLGSQVVLKSGFKLGG